MSPNRSPWASRRSARPSRAKIIGIGFVFLWFLIGGIAHFALPGLEASIVPPYIPRPQAVVAISGVFELLGAIGLLFAASRKAAGWGLFALTIAVTPANVYMLQNPALFHIPYWLLVIRLPVQVALLALILWSTAASDEGPSNDHPHRFA